MWYKRRMNKYNNGSKIYNNMDFDSAKEADYCKTLDLRKKAGEIVSYERQVKISVDFNDFHIFNYYADFVVTLPSGLKEIHEVKGYLNEVARFKYRVLEAIWLPQHLDYDFVMIT